MSEPSVSVIIPTHNRAAMLLRHLEALARQDWPADDVELIVVADACQDDTAARAEAFAARAPFALRLISHAARSAAATRQAGARAARGRTLIFLDDDIAVEPGFVRAHLAAGGPDTVVLGYSRPVLPARPTRWQRDAHRWWEDTFSAFAQPGHRFSYRDFFSGNASLPAALFWRAGGFDPSFNGRLEDYELGLRLIKAGARFRYEPAACGDHHDQTDLTQWMRRIRQEGVADVQIAERHVELRSTIFGPLYHPSLIRRLLRFVAFRWPKQRNRLQAAALRLIGLLERFGLRHRWSQAVWTLREYTYFCGVASQLGNHRDYLSWIGRAAPRPKLSIDAPVIDLAALPEGRALEELLATASAKGALLNVGQVTVLAVTPQPGAEPLQVRHLRAALRRAAAGELIPALALAPAAARPS